MPRGITEKDVFTACDALLLAGERPTIERVRQKIGRGSPNTVSPMLDTWFKGLGRRLQDPGAFAPAADAPDPILQAAQHFWEVAQAQSRHDIDARVSAGLAEAAVRVDEAMRTAAQAQAAAADAAARIDALEATLTASRESLEGERLNHRGTTTQLSSATDRCSALERQVAQLQQSAIDERARADEAIAAANARGDGAERRAAMEIEAERMLRARAEKASQTAAQKLETTIRELAAATEQVAAAREQLVMASTRADHREQQLQAELAGREAQIHELEAALGRARSALSSATGQDELVAQIIAKLTSAGRAHAVEPTDQGSRRGTRKKVAPT